MQGCGSNYFVNHFRVQQSLDSISSMNFLTSMTIKTSSLRFTRAHYQLKWSHKLVSVSTVLLLCSYKKHNLENCLQHISIQTALTTTWFDLLISAARPTRHGELTYKTNKDTCVTSTHWRQLYTPHHPRDKSIGDPDRNRHFNNPESHLFMRKKTSETLQPGHWKTLRLSSPSAPAQRSISAISKRINEDNCVNQRNRPEIKIVQVFQLPYH